MQIKPGAGFLFNDTAEYFCPNGFDLTGSPESVCLSNKSWSSPAPTCRPSQCKPPLLVSPMLFANINTSFMGTAYLTCEPGYSVINGEQPLVCLANGSWSVLPGVPCQGKLVCVLINLPLMAPSLAH